MTKKTDQSSRRRKRSESDDQPGKDWSSVASGWRHWEPSISSFTWPVTLRIVDLIRPSPGDRVLDVGCGTGDTTLAIASMTAPTGWVLAIDPAAEMIETAQARAKSLAIGAIDFRVTSIEDLDTPRRSLHAVCGRWSFIFCPDMPTVLLRIRASLKIGGRFAMSAWSPLKDCPAFAIVNAAVNRRLHLPPPDSAKPGMFHLSAPGRLAAALNKAGFYDVRVEAVRLSIFARSGEDFWEMMSAMGHGLRNALSGMTPRQRAATRHDVITAAEEYRVGDVLRIPVLANVASGKA